MDNQDPEAVLQAEQAKLAQIEAEMHAVKAEKMALRQRAVEVKGRHAQQVAVVTAAIKARPNRNAQKVGDQ